jgi:hypothetical protein
VVGPVAADPVARLVMGPARLAVKNPSALKRRGESMAKAPVSSVSPALPGGPSKPGSGYGIFAAIVLSALVIAGFFIVNRFEIYEREKWSPPSLEFQSNRFYILGEWLSASGRPVRFSPRWTGVKDISPREGGLFIQASLFDWDREDILPWVREGGVLVVSVDSPWYWESEQEEEVSPAALPLEKFLGKLGLRIRESFQEDEDPFDGGEDNAGSTIIDEESAGEADTLAGEGGDSIANQDESPDFPDYDYRIVFEDPGLKSEYAAGSAAEELPPGGRFLTLRDSEGNIRLIRRPLGKGLVAVTGSCVFMYNYQLAADANARLAWGLTGGSLGPERPGFLFIRGRQSSGGVWGILGARGNLLPPVLSALALIFTGFWMALSGFGVPPREESRRRLSITGRFSTEARFLRRYNALGAYLEIYLRELRRRGRGRALGREFEELEEALAAGKKIGRQKTAVYLKNLMSALERI